MNATNTFTLWISIAFLLVITADAKLSDDFEDRRLHGGSSTRRLALTKTPQNHAALVGETVVLECVASQSPPFVHIMWGEFISNIGGSIISDNDFILDHPNRDRYRIIHDSPEEFHLEIRDVRMEDGGRYVCQDTLSGPPTVFRGEAELIVIESVPTCASTMPADGVVLEGQTYTAECVVRFQGQYAPTMTWTGPPPFLVGQSPPNPSASWSGIQFTVNRTMLDQQFECLTNFTDIGSTPVDVANNTPIWEHRYQVSDPLGIYWGPKDMYAVPMKSEYSVGDNVTCYADSYPPAFYQWQNMGNLQTFIGQSFTVNEDMVGSNHTFRCLAMNLISGTVYNMNLFIPVYVPAPTTIPTTPVTTTQPAQSPCGDLSGYWLSESPYAEMILQVDHNSQTGEIMGIMKNQSDTVWVEVVGTVTRGDFLYLGLTAIWPFSEGITGMAGECHRCHGTEVLMTESLWRSVAQGVRCEVAGTPAPDAAYTFHRLSTSTSLLQQQELDVYRPTQQVSGSLGIKLKR